MIFECKDETSSEIKYWTGRIKEFENHGTHYEIRIDSRSGILVIVGKSTGGAFACIPDFRAGCHLANPRDKFWNTEKLTEVLGKVDGITVANAIYALRDEIEF